jgi:hypothetical protein
LILSILDAYLLLQEKQVRQADLAVGENQKQKQPKVSMQVTSFDVCSAPVVVSFAPNHMWQPIVVCPLQTFKHSQS